VAAKTAIEIAVDIIHVPDPAKGECADPVNGAAIMGKEGPDP
jgi:hypothetical protein